MCLQKIEKKMLGDSDPLTKSKILILLCLEDESWQAKITWQT